jgi:hypothetical protein
MCLLLHFFKTQRAKETTSVRAGIGPGRHAKRPFEAAVQMTLIAKAGAVRDF